VPQKSRIQFAFFASLIGTLVLATDDVLEILGLGWIAVWDDTLFDTILELVIYALMASAVVVLFLEIKRMRRHVNDLENRIELASEAFLDMLQGYFDKWSLSSSEREVVLLLLKGCTISEISEVRGTAEGTVKAQTNSIYKKSGYSNKTQLLSSFIEDLTNGESVGVQMNHAR